MTTVADLQWSWYVIFNPQAQIPTGNYPSAVGSTMGATLTASSMKHYILDWGTEMAHNIGAGQRIRIKRRFKLPVSYIRKGDTLDMVFRKLTVTGTITAQVDVQYYWRG